MSILINGMAMPQNCRECRFMETVHRLDGRERYICIAHLNEITNLKERLDTCPLVELPDHGDLIDRDKLIFALEMQDYSCAPDTLEEWTPTDMTKAEIADLKCAPVVIPAERSESDE